MQPRKTAAMRQLEERHGKPLEQLIPALYAQLGTDVAVADALYISRVTLYHWCARLGLTRSLTAAAAPAPAPERR